MLFTLGKNIFLIFFFEFIKRFSFYLIYLVLLHAKKFEIVEKNNSLKINSISIFEFKNAFY